MEGIVHDGEDEEELSPLFLAATTPKPGAFKLEVLVRAHAAIMLTLGSFWVQGPVEAR